MQNALNFVKNSHMLRRNEPMNTSDFWYDLPEELIAQTPLGQRDASTVECHTKMLVCFLIEQARQTLGLRFLELLFHRTEFIE